MHIGIHTAGLAEAISSSEKRLILHLGLYQEFMADASFNAALHECLGRVSFRECHILTVPDNLRFGWVEEFMAVLRPGHNPATFEHDLAASRDALVRLAAYHPGQINLYELRSLGCTPLVITDSQIFFTQFCASEVPLVQGLWGVMKADIDKLSQWAMAGAAPQNASPKERAAFRLVHECYRLMRPAKRMLL